MTWVIRRRHLPRNPRSAAARVVVPRLRQLSDETVVANLKLQRRTESYRRHSKEKVGEANRTWTKRAMSKTQEADACGHCGRSKHVGGQQCPASDRNCRRYGKKGHYDTKKADNAGGASGSSTKVVAIRAHPSKVGRQCGEMFRPVRIGAIQAVASDRIEEAPRIKLIVESSDKVNVIEMLPDTGADICAGDPEFLEQMDGHGNNLIDTNVRIRAEGIADAIGLGIVQQRQHADGGWTTIKAGSQHSTDMDDVGAKADALSRIQIEEELA